MVQPDSIRGNEMSLFLTVVNKNSIFKIKLRYFASLEIEEFLKFK